jgi:hypothetical protein
MEELYYGLRSCVMLRGIGWCFITNVSGQPTGTLPLKMVPTDCSETSVTKHEPTPRYIQMGEGLIFTAAEA